MFKMPTDNWGPKERLDWQVAVARNLRWSQFTMQGFIFAAAGVFDVTVTAALDDARLAGLRIGMPVTVSPSSTLAASVIVGAAWVATNDTLSMRIVNVSAVPVNQAAATWSYFGVLL